MGCILALNLYCIHNIQSKYLHSICSSYHVYVYESMCGHVSVYKHESIVFVFRIIYACVLIFVSLVKVSLILSLPISRSLSLSIHHHFTVLKAPNLLLQNMPDCGNHTCIQYVLTTILLLLSVLHYSDANNTHTYVNTRYICMHLTKCMHLLTTYISDTNKREERDCVKWDLCVVIN